MKNDVVKIDKGRTLKEDISSKKDQFKRKDAKPNTLTEKKTPDHKKLIKS